MFTILGADGKEYGPVTAGKLHEWIAAGRANMLTKARRDGETEWKTLGDFPELSQFGTTGSTPAMPVLPPAYQVTSVANPTASLELEPASRWLRLGAILLDSIIGGILMLPGFGLLLSAGFFTHRDQPNTPLLLAGFSVVVVTMLIVMGIQIYLLTTRGQTMGKKLLGIKIVNFDDEANPGFVKAVLLRGLVNGLIGCIPMIGWVYSLVDICFIFRADRRCLHDLIAGTKVVKA
jgi:uncharacterized RDD family membrane protein YckC